MTTDGGETSSVTVFIIPPRDVILKVGHQSLRGVEFICELEVPVMSMIALSGFIVVSENARSVDNIGQPILVLMYRTR